MSPKSKTVRFLVPRPTPIAVEISPSIPFAPRFPKTFRPIRFAAYASRWRTGHEAATKI